MEFTEKELLNMTKLEAIDDLDDRQIAFCEQYIKAYNMRMSAIKAGYSPKSAHIIANKLMDKPEVRRYLSWLKLRVLKRNYVNACDIVEQYTKIAFADITDFVDLKSGRVKIKDADEIDGQLVVEVKTGRDGVTVKLADKMVALDKLEKYLNVMPADWKQKLEEKKLEILQKRLELEMLRAGQGGEETEDDGFIEALQGTVKEVWDNEVDEDETEPI